MIYPKSLDIGYKVGVTATSEGNIKEVDIIRLDNAILHFENHGYPVVETDNVRKSNKGRSSDGKTRAIELKQLYENSSIRAIFAAAGGDYLVEMLSFVDFNIIKNNPKWFQGFSDTTGLTFTITTNLDIATIYANNFSTFGMEKWHSSLIDNIKMLEGFEIIQNSFDKYQNGYKARVTGFEEFVLEEEVQWVNVYPEDMEKQKEINLSGRAIGGCIDVLLTLCGTRFDKTKEFVEKYKEDGIVWFLESFDLNSEALTRGLWQLREAGWFSHATGFIFGRPAMFGTNTDTTYEEAVISVLGELNVPIILDADIGHKPPQCSMICGAIVNIHSKEGKGTITFERR